MPVSLLNLADEKLMTLLGICAVLAVGGFAAGLLAGLLLRFPRGHVLAGIILKATRPFRRGDQVSVDGNTGIVMSFGWLHTRLALPDNSVLFVSSIDLMGSTIVNHTARSNRRMDMRFTIAHGSDLEAAADIIKEVLSKDPRVLPTPPPRIAIAESGAGGLALVAQPWVPVGNYQQVRSETAAAIRRLLASEGIRLQVTGEHPHHCRFVSCSTPLAS
jgi:small conductance mechanosensitive channel